MRSTPIDGGDASQEPLCFNADRCACGCGQRATRLVWRVPEWHRMTAEALGWDRILVRKLREPVRVAAGHGNRVAGYIPASGYH